MLAVLVEPELELAEAAAMMMMVASVVRLYALIVCGCVRFRLVWYVSY